MITMTNQQPAQPIRERVRKYFELPADVRVRLIAEQLQAPKEREKRDGQAT